jgi:sulfur-oxidizing protein SoxY
MTPVSQSAHRPSPPLSARARRSKPRILPLAVLALLCPTVLAAAEDETEQRWTEIRTALFGDRAVTDGQGILALDTPYRAEDAAVVPIAIRSLLDPATGRRIKTLYLVIDMNPSPVAATFRFPTARAWDALSTRVRVNAYTHVRAIAETDDGRLAMVSNYVKASGGCSAPSLKDPAAAASQLGRMKLLLPEQVRPGERLAAQILVKHPNSSGMQFDQVSRQFIPADYVKRIEASYRGEPLFTADTDISISEDPSIRFSFVPESSGDLVVQVKDSKGRAFEERAPVAAAGGG